MHSLYFLFRILVVLINVLGKLYHKKGDVSICLSGVVSGLSESGFEDSQDKDKIYLSNFKHITSKAKVAFVFVFSMRDLVLKIVWMACCIRKRE